MGGGSDRAFRSWGFSSLKEYSSALGNLGNIIATRSFSPLLPADPVKESGEAMKKVLGAFDLVCLGIGMMLGAGVFVTTGYVAADVAGPSVIISYVAAGISAMLSSFCYAEFAVDIPAAGGAYTYIAAALGEFLAWLTVANLIFEYVLANAAAIRGFAPYFGTLTNKAEDFYIQYWRSPQGIEFQLDWWAFGWCIVLSILLILGTKESAWFNGIITVVHVLLVVFIIIAGFIKAKPSNLKPSFIPFGLQGTFNGASIVFFSYIGFDAVATAAEETRNTRRDLPIGILGSVLIVTILYILMAAALVLMVPQAALTKMSTASFASAFRYVKLNWATYIVALGALMGIVTTTLVGMYGVSRIITGVARDHLIPPFLAKVGGRAATPWIAIVIQGVAAAVLSLLSPFSELADMVSISTLFAFWVVALGLMWRRSCTDGAGGGGHLPGLETPNDSAHAEKPAGPVGESTEAEGVAGVAVAAPGALARRRLTAAILLIAINAGALIFTIGWRVPADGSKAYKGCLIAGAIIFVVATAAFQFMVPPMYTPPRYVAPLYPWLPAFSMLFNIFLLGQLNELAYERFGIWSAVCIVIYFFYAGVASWNKAQYDKSALPTSVLATELVAPPAAEAS